MKKDVIQLSSKIVSWLKPYSKKIEVVGSIRRGSKNPGDIDIVLIPKDKEKIKSFLSKKGKFVKGGESIHTYKIEGVKVELYFTNSDEWGATLMTYSGPSGANIGLRIIARAKGFKLTQHGLFNRKTGDYVAGKTERDIYKALNRPYKEPSER